MDGMIDVCGRPNEYELILARIMQSHQSFNEDDEEIRQKEEEKRRAGAGEWDD